MKENIRYYINDIQNKLSTPLNTEVRTQETTKKQSKSKKHKNNINKHFMAYLQ
ncbi:hypothetical protein EJ73_00452 [Hoylesella shahii DSM 15611 = JCM 12083]|uniref:Uncharacterized protein n=1 Tax=Hoylesella shahii DSM 15611 = JCM 12083 TaxID=1122991 RepID=A0A318I8Q0_9BACT|nr:hypothetical protein EJ73_00452 [Hoylesella shahii DSM 15611 = JCM 12083]